MIIKRFVLCFCLILLPALPLYAAVDIDVTRGVTAPTPIAIPNFYGTNGSDSINLGIQIAKIVADDLQRSSLFRPLDKNAFPQTPEQLYKETKLASWRGGGSDLLAVGQVTVTGKNASISFRLWDVQTEQQMTGVLLTSETTNWRRVGHLVADAIYERVTGEKGYFDTRLVYISETGPKNRRIKRLAIIDQDGANNKFLSAGKELVLTPRFSPLPGDQTIVYMSYRNNKPKVYLFNIDSGKQEALGAFPGMTFAPRFSPDASHVIMSYAKGGNSDIYTMDLKTRKAVRLTSGSSIETSPCYSPDGKYITYNSDEAGTQQIYVMNADGSDQKRISFGAGRYATPVWSPRGDLIAFTKIKDGQFYIGVMQPDGSGERILTHSFLDEGPTWAPNGRTLAFFRQSPGAMGAVKIYTIDLSGYNERLLPTPQFASDPAWSPFSK